MVAAVLWCVDVFLGPMVKIQGIMNKENYLDILDANLPYFVNESVYSAKFLFVFFLARRGSVAHSQDS